MAYKIDYRELKSARRMNPSFTLTKRSCRGLYGLLRITFIKGNYLCIEQCHYANDASGDCSNCADLGEEQREE